MSKFSMKVGPAKKFMTTFFDTINPNTGIMIPKNI